MAAMFSNRATHLRAEGVPIRFTWEGALLGGGPLCLLREAPRPLAARALLDFMFSQPEAAAAYSEAQHVATFVRGAADYLDADFGQALVTHSDNWPLPVRMDPVWIREHRDETIQRWTAWISG